MATKKFQREPKMKTTEPSADEVGGGMKKGGKTKKMAMGGMNPMAAIAPRRQMAMAPAMMRRKSGGEVESKAEQRREDARMSKIEKELHHHEAMKAKKAHHGLKMGGKAAFAKDNTPGGLLGGLEATRPNKKKTSGGIELTGYKKGGMLAAKGDAFQARSAMKPKINVQDKVNDGSHNKKLGSKTGKVTNTVAGSKAGGYKKGGTVSQSVASRYVNDMQDGQGRALKKKSSGSLELSKFKKGGHVTMTCKNEGGFTQMKKMAKC
jgi:hypothetical protein